MCIRIDSEGFFLFRAKLDEIKARKSVIRIDA